MANSPGWKLIGPRLTQMRAPPTLVPSPGTSGSSSRPAPMNEERPLVAGQVGGALHDQQRGDEGDDGDERPRGLQAGERVR